MCTVSAKDNTHDTCGSLKYPAYNPPLSQWTAVEVYKRNFWVHFNIKLCGVYVTLSKFIQRKRFRRRSLLQCSSLVWTTYSLRSAPVSHRATTDIDLPPPTRWCLDRHKLISSGCLLDGRINRYYFRGGWEGRVETVGQSYWSMTTPRSLVVCTVHSMIPS